MSKHITNDATLIANLFGNVTGNLTGNVTGNVTGNLTGAVTGNASTATLATTATTANGLAYTTSSPATPVVTWTSGSSTVGGATFTRSTVIPLDATYGINHVSLYIEFTAVSTPTVPFTIKINSKNATDTTNVDVTSYNSAASNSRAMKGLLTASGDTISIPSVYGLSVAAGSFFTANFSYKCTL